MKFTAPRAALLAACRLAAAAVHTGRTPIKAVRGAKLAAGPDGLTLTATDLVSTLAVTVADAEINRPGSGIIDPKKLGELLGSLRCDTIEASLREVDLKYYDNVCGRHLSREITALCFTADGSDWKLALSEADEFPDADPPSGEPIEVNAAALRRAIGRVAFAAGQPTDFRPTYETDGILFEADRENLLLAATNKARIATVRIPIASQDAGETKRSALMPLRAARLLAEALADVPDAAAVRFSTRSIAVNAGSIALAARLVDGKFPPYRQMLAARTEHEAELPRLALLSAVRQCAAVFEKGGRRIDLDFRPGAVVVSAGGFGTGTARVDAGVEFEARCSAPYADLLGALEAAGGDVIRFGIAGPQVMIRGDGEFACVIKQLAVAAEKELAHA